MEQNHDTRTTIDEATLLYTITCSCGEKTKLRLCGTCKRRPASEARGGDSCEPCAQ